LRERATYQGERLRVSNPFRPKGIEPLPAQGCPNVSDALRAPREREREGESEREKKRN